MLDRPIDTPCVVPKIWEDDPVPDYGGPVPGWSYVEICIGSTVIGTSKDFPFVCNGPLWQLWEVNGYFEEMDAFCAYVFCNWFPIEVVSLIIQKMSTGKTVTQRLISTCPCQWESIRE